MRVIMNLASNIYCLSNGKMLASGKPDELQNDPRVIDAYLDVLSFFTTDGGTSYFGSQTMAAVS